MQATDRLAMIQQMGRLIQQTVTAAAYSVLLTWYSPLLLLLLVGGVIPAFIGESHFAFLTYAKNFSQTPVRRQMDYLRQVGGSKEAAKELKLFNLSEYLTERFKKLSREFTRKTWPSAVAAFSGLDCWRFLPSSATTRPTCSASTAHSTALHHRRPDGDHDCDHAGHEQHPANVFDGVGRRRSGAIPH